MINREQLRERLTGTRLFKKVTNKQWEGIEALLNACANHQVVDSRQVAYILGTVYHEVAGTMQPIKEFGKGHNRTYGHRVWYNGKPYFDVMHIYYGRGFTQNTWREIYKSLTAAAKRAGHTWDFENDPEMLLQIEPSAWASVYAMKTGLYTGRKLDTYFNDLVTDWINARRIINGTRKGEKYPDRAEDVAGYAQIFYKAIS